MNHNYKVDAIKKEKELSTTQEKLSQTNKSLKDIKDRALIKEMHFKQMALDTKNFNDADFRVQIIKNLEPLVVVD